MLVTGGSRGIGSAIALRLASEGADVAVNYASNAEAAQEMVAEIEGLGRRAAAYQADIADRAACQAMAEAVIADFGQIDLVVNNAGIGSSYIDRPTIIGATYEQHELLLGANLGGRSICARRWCRT